MHDQIQQPGAAVGQLVEVAGESVAVDCVERVLVAAELVDEEFAAEAAAEFDVQVEAEDATDEGKPSVVPAESVGVAECLSGFVLVGQFHLFEAAHFAVQLAAHCVDQEEVAALEFDMVEKQSAYVVQAKPYELVDFLLAGFVVAQVGWALYLVVCNEVLRLGYVEHAVRAAIPLLPVQLLVVFGREPHLLQVPAVEHTLRPFVQGLPNLFYSRRAKTY